MALEDAVAEPPDEGNLVLTPEMSDVLKRAVRRYRGPSQALKPPRMPYKRWDILFKLEFTVSRLTQSEILALSDAYPKLFVDLGLASCEE